MSSRDVVPDAAAARRAALVRSSTLRITILPMQMRGLFLIVSVFVTACGDPPWVGKFDANATWNISGPLADGRTVGDAVADLLVGELVGALPAPDAILSRVQEAADALVRVPVKTLVDAAAPSSLQPDGAITLALQEALGSVLVESTLELEEATLDDMEGTETLRRVTLTVGTETIELAPADLLGRAGKLRAEWEGDEDDQGLEVFDHEVPLHYGALVLRAAEELVDAQGLTELQAGVTAALDCAGIVADILDGKSGLTLSVAGWSHTIEAATFAATCDAVKSVAGERALGLFALDAGVTIGGKLTVKESKSKVTLSSRAGFGGTVNVAPEVIAPKLEATMTAVRAK